MSRYEVYATRFDNPAIVDELVPARGLSFSLPLNDHGECTFTSTVEPGLSMWRPTLALPLSGVLVARDGVPWWDGVLVAEQQSGPRSFSFTAREWGWFLEEKIAASPHQWPTLTNDHQIFRDLIDDAQAVAGQNLMIDTGSSLGASSSVKTDLTAWAKTTVGKEFRKLGEAAGGPDWYISIGGTLDNPVRQLYLADRHGHIDPQAVLEYVEATVPADAPDQPAKVALLGDLFPGPAPRVPDRRAGGNVIALGRSRQLGEAATAVVATGAGQEKAQLRKTATASALLAAGWPRMTSFVDDSTVQQADTLLRNARAELAKRSGIATAYSLVTLDPEAGEVTSADWTNTPRGSNVQAVLDTDVYGGDQPVGGADGFTTRCINTVVRVPDSGTAQVEWQVADVLEVQ
ncbi:hypothetical protein G7075_04285 [Phycicoccus sp. HDW14]|uniref:hypothetical protein n=1 Tax=Phycicoccus sp. HDW14 TaxID=2714941 RepID=UPI00140D19F9|nr:hypothetical protein [Phycicoccus sp. HDW14]QIM20536.1 hypothetical protein G7075_04285 [Phycicoccus sp. HDW14]